MKTCNQCLASLDSGSVTTYVNGEATKTLCFACSKAECFKEYTSSKIITTSLLLDSQMIMYDVKHSYPLKPGEFAYLKYAIEIDEAREKLQSLTKSFEKVVWFGGLQDLLEKESSRGVSAKYNFLTVMTYCIAGRCMITFESEDNYSFTIVADEDSKESRTGIQGIHATLPQAEALVSMAINAWKNGELVFKPDEAISIAGV